MNKRRFVYLLPMILLLIVAVTGWFVTDYLANKARQEIIGENRASVSTLSVYVSATLGKFEDAVKSLAGSPWIAPALLSKEERDIEQANSVLDRYSSAFTATSYLMDADGMTVASSNRKDPDSFVGESYSFRPYFQEAVKGQPGRYFALGITSGKRGFYASYPVQNLLGKAVGVVTMKKDIDEIETFFSNYPYCFLISRDGIIFISSTPAMVTKSLWPLDKAVRETLIASRQFGNKLSDAVIKKNIADGTEVALEENEYFVSMKVIDSDGWSIVLLTPTDRIRLYRLIGILATVSVGFLIVLFSAIIYVTDQSKEATRQSAEKIRESEERFRRLANATWEGIIIHREGIILEANESTSKILGYPVEEIIGKHIIDFLPPESIEPAMQKLREGITSDQLYLEVKLLRKDKTVISVEALGRPIRYNHVDARVIAFRDITERKRAEAEKEELEAQNWKLQKAESLGRMAGAIAHHFNNQLGAVMGNLELALIGLSKGAQPHANITEAMKASRRAAEVSEQMLTYLGQTPGTREPLDLYEACRRSLPLLRVAMPEDVALEIDLPSPGPAVSANVNQIQQVLTNLVTNAREAFGEGRGAIHLAVKTVLPADIAAATRFPVDWQPHDNAYACLEVADTACGIAEKDIEKLFDPFYSSKFTGRGLGLAVVLGIVRAHEGVVTVESETGHGSVFRVFFPVSTEEIPRRPEVAAKAKTPERGGGGTVLLVEDEEALRNMAATMLTHLGFTVLAAKDGIEAVEVFRQHQDEIRCVLCDLTMPRMNGWETLTALRALRPDIPVILASGYDLARVMDGDHPERPQVFLGKPYRMAELKTAIEAALT